MQKFVPGGSGSARVGLENGRDGGYRLALRVHVHMGVDVHGDLRAVVPGELLHHLGVHAADGKQGEVRMAKLVKTPSVETVLGAVLGPPTAKARGQDAGAAVVGDDGAPCGP